MTQNYSIKEGKLYCNGELANIEFGNTDLINFIKRENERLEMLQGEGYEIDIDVETIYKAEGRFKCLCGSTVWIESEEDDEDEAINALVGEKTCRNCKRQYEIAKDNDDEITAFIKKS